MNHLVEIERPRTLDQLTQELVRARREKMVNLIEDVLSQGRLYRPNETYEVGDTLVFPHRGNELGEVVALRSGHNPEYDNFFVAKVRMEDGHELEFVTELDAEHPLNTATYMPIANLSVEDIYERHGDSVEAALRTSLETQPEFLSVAYQWFLRDLVVEISPGNLNIAEALLDMEGGGPLRTEAFLEEIVLPDEISRPLQLFSLEYALLHDRRFDEVGPAGYALWYLRRMEPPEVLETPSYLHYIPIPYNRGTLDEMMLALERRLDDEWSEAEPPDTMETPVTLVLTYPHLRSGSLPLAPRVSRLFPTARITDRVRFTFVDGETGDEFPGWVVLSGRYVYGLTELYETYDVGVGSYIDLEPGEQPGTIVVSVRPIRSQRREWLRTVTVQGGQLAFEVMRVPVSCEFDELMAVAVPNPASIDAFARENRQASLEALIDQMFGGLAGLSLQRAVHSATLYSVMNLLRRVPPAPLMAVLATSSRYVSLGDNYWAYRGEA
jgi:hypothetical protein